MSREVVSPSFAEWQFSRRIVPWTIVHNWSEYRWLEDRMAASLTGLGRQIGEALVPVLQKMTAVVLSMLDALDLSEGE